VGSICKHIGQYLQYAAANVLYPDDQQGLIKLLCTIIINDCIIDCACVYYFTVVLMRANSGDLNYKTRDL
jgi:hypothetical protein